MYHDTQRYNRMYTGNCTEHGPRVPTKPCYFLNESVNCITVITIMPNRFLRLLWRALFLLSFAGFYELHPLGGRVHSSDLKEHNGKLSYHIQY